MLKSVTKIFYLAIEQSTEYVWFVKGKQLASYQALIKSSRSHLLICDESNNAYINWNHKCSFDWLCVLCSVNPPLFLLQYYVANCGFAVSCNV